MQPEDRIVGGRRHERHAEVLLRRLSADVDVNVAVQVLVEVGAKAAGAARKIARERHVVQIENICAGDRLSAIDAVLSLRAKQRLEYRIVLHGELGWQGMLLRVGIVPEGQ